MRYPKVLPEAPEDEESEEFKNFRAEVTYMDKSIKTYNVYQWRIHKPDLIRNLYNRGLCSVVYYQA